MEDDGEEWREVAEQIRADSRQLRRQTEMLLAGDNLALSPGPSQRDPTPTPPAAPPPPERIYVYAPRENKCPRFSGDCNGQDSTIEDWVKEVRKALAGQPLSPLEQVTWVYDLLDGEAKREVTFSIDLECARVEEIFAVLLDHFGCDQTYVAIQRQFFHRRQGEKETLREFTQALATLLQQLQTKDPRVVPLPDMVLRDTFIENIFSSKLHQELTQVLRAHPDHSFREIRDVATWERRQAALGAARPPTAAHVSSLSTATPVGTVEVQTAQPISREIQECREAIQKQQAQLDLILQHLATPASVPWTTPTPRPSQRRRPLPFQPDGTPICLKCGEPGHYARHCERSRPSRQYTAAQADPRGPATPRAENASPTAL